MERPGPFICEEAADINLSVEIITTSFMIVTVLMPIARSVAVFRIIGVTSLAAWYVSASRWMVKLPEKCLMAHET